jgi:hypothetical protein
LGERRLVDAVRSLVDRHRELRDVVPAACVRRVVLPSALVPAAASSASSASALAPPAGVPLRVIWFDGGAEGRILLVVRRDVLAALPWRVLLPGLASAWKANPERALLRAS